MSSPCRKLPTNCNHILLEEDDPFLVGITIDVKTLECITVMTPLQKQTTKTSVFFSNEILEYVLRLYSNITLCIPTAHYFTRAFKKMAVFFLRLDLAIEVNRHFLENGHSDLSFFPLF